jgi:hypothetical protein
MYQRFLLLAMLTMFSIQVKAQYLHYDPIPYVPEPDLPTNTPTQPAPMLYGQPYYPKTDVTKDQVYIILNIEYASINNKDFSTEYQNDTTKLVIYRKNTVLCMSLFMLAKHSQSFGKITNVVNDNNTASNTTYYTSISTFDWSYANSYNNDSGVAKVMIKQVNNPSGITFVAEVKTDSMDMIFQGHKQR